MAKRLEEVSKRLVDSNRELYSAFVDAGIWSQERRAKFAQLYVSELRKAQGEVVTPFTTFINHTKQAQEVVLDYWKTVGGYSLRGLSAGARFQARSIQDGVSKVGEQAAKNLEKIEESVKQAGNNAHKTERKAGKEQEPDLKDVLEDVILDENLKPGRDYIVEIKGEGNESKAIKVEHVNESDRPKDKGKR